MGNIPPPGLQLPISLLCRLNSWRSRSGDLSDWTSPSCPTPARWAVGGGAGPPLCRGSLCPKHLKIQLLPSSQSELQDPTHICLKTGFFMNSWPFFISSQIPSVGSMHTSKGNTDSSANPSYTDINKQELCWSSAGTAAFPHANEESISQAERHVKSHVGDGCLQGLNVQGVGHTWDLFGYFASSKLDTNLRIHI